MDVKELAPGGDVLALDLAILNDLLSSHVEDLRVDTGQEDPRVSSGVGISGVSAVVETGLSCLSQFLIDAVLSAEHAVVVQDGLYYLIIVESEVSRERNKGMNDSSVGGSIGRLPEELTIPVAVNLLLHFSPLLIETGSVIVVSHLTGEVGHVE